MVDDPSPAWGQDGSKLSDIVLYIRGLDVNEHVPRPDSVYGMGGNKAQITTVVNEIINIPKVLKPCFAHFNAHRGHIHDNEVLRPGKQAFSPTASTRTDFQNPTAGGHVGFQHMLNDTGFPFRRI
jgi:hypothetical protein